MPENKPPRVDLRTAVPPSDAVPDARVLSVKIRGWNDIYVAYHRFLPGELDLPPMTGHVVALHLGSPVKTVQRREGRVHKGVHAKGDIEIIPAGCPGCWEFDGADEGISFD